MNGMYGAMNLTQTKSSPLMFFNHYSFNKAVMSIFNKRLHMDEFEEMIDKEVMYYFWRKAEYEVMINGLFERGAKTKIDIYSQLKLNWDRFIDYLWNEYINKID